MMQKNKWAGDWLWAFLILFCAQASHAETCRFEPDKEDRLPATCYDPNVLNICYISLNNPKEFVLAEEFVRKIQAGRKVPHPIQVFEVQRKGDSPETTFDRLIRTGVTCHGLVLSGHHTGSWGGTQAQGSLQLDTLEQASCDPKSKSFFEKINSLWLQGCRTLGHEGSILTPNPNNPTNDLVQFHANRVVPLMREDNLDGNYMTLQSSFAQVFDSFTPYASRINRAFPKANIFGWSYSSIGVNAKSEYSLPFHIADLAAILKGGSNGRPISMGFSNPLKALDTKSADAYYQALVFLLQSNKSKCVTCAKEAWIAHGNVNTKKGVYGFDNPRLDSMVPVADSGDTVLKKAKDLDCRIRSAKKYDELAPAVKEAASDPLLLGYTAKSLQRVLNLLKNRYGFNEAFSSFELADVVGYLRDNPNMKKFLVAALNSQNMGLARKLEYYRLYNDVTEERIPAVEEAIHNLSLEVVNSPNTNIDLDARETIFKALFDKDSVLSIDPQQYLTKVTSTVGLSAAFSAALYTWGDNPLANALRSKNWLDQKEATPLLLKEAVRFFVGRQSEPDAPQRLREVVEILSSHLDWVDAEAYDTLLAIGRANFPKETQRKMSLSIIRQRLSKREAKDYFRSSESLAAALRMVMSEGDLAEFMTDLIKEDVPLTFDSAAFLAATFNGNFKPEEGWAAKISSDVRGKYSTLAARLIAFGFEGNNSYSYSPVVSTLSQQFDLPLASFRSSVVAAALNLSLGKESEVRQLFNLMQWVRSAFFGYWKKGQISQDEIDRVVWSTFEPRIPIVQKWLGILTGDNRKLLTSKLSEFLADFGQSTINPPRFLIDAVLHGYSDLTVASTVLLNFPENSPRETEQLFMKKMEARVSQYENGWWNSYLIPEIWICETSEESSLRNYWEEGYACRRKRMPFLTSASMDRIANLVRDTESRGRVRIQLAILAKKDFSINDLAEIVLAYPNEFPSLQEIFRFKRILHFSPIETARAVAKIWKTAPAKLILDANNYGYMFERAELVEFSKALKSAIAPFVDDRPILSLGYFFVSSDRIGNTGSEEILDYLRKVKIENISIEEVHTLLGSTSYRLPLPVLKAVDPAAYEKLIEIFVTKVKSTDEARLRMLEGIQMEWKNWLASDATFQKISPIFEQQSYVQKAFDTYDSSSLNMGGYLGTKAYRERELNKWLELFDANPNHQSILKSYVYLNKEQWKDLERREEVWRRCRDFEMAELDRDRSFSFTRLLETAQVMNLPVAGVFNQILDALADRSKRARTKTSRDLVRRAEGELVRSIERLRPTEDIQSLWPAVQRVIRSSDLESRNDYHSNIKILTGQYSIWPKEEAKALLVQLVDGCLQVARHKNECFTPFNKASDIRLLPTSLLEKDAESSQGADSSENYFRILIRLELYLRIQDPRYLNDIAELFPNNKPTLVFNLIESFSGLDRDLPLWNEIDSVFLDLVKKTKRDSSSFSSWVFPELPRMPKTFQYMVEAKFLFNDRTKDSDGKEKEDARKDEVAGEIMLALSQLDLPQDQRQKLIDDFMNEKRPKGIPWNEIIFRLGDSKYQDHFKEIYPQIRHWLRKAIKLDSNSAQTLDRLNIDRDLKEKLLLETIGIGFGSRQSQSDAAKGG